MTDINIAGVKLRLRRDTIYMKTDGGILFKGRGRSFTINGNNVYQAFSKLARLLNGTVPTNQILDAAAPSARPALHRLLQTLLRSNLLIAIDEHDASSIDARLCSVFASQIDFLRHHGARPHTRFQAFRTQRILLAGNGTSIETAASALLRNGLRQIWITPDGAYNAALCEAEIRRLARLGVESQMHILTTGAAASMSFDLIVYCADEPDFARLHQMNFEALEKRQHFLPAYFHGEKSLIGPFTAPDRAGCWHCAMLRWTERVTAASAIQTWIAIAGVKSARRDTSIVSELSGQILGNNLGLEIFKHYVNLTRPWSSRQVLVQDCSSLESSMDALLPHPECPRCVRIGAFGAMAANRLDTEETTPLMSWMPYLNGRLAMFNGFHDDSIEQLPLRLSVLRLNRTEKAQDSVIHGFIGWSLRNSEDSRTHALEAALCHDWLERFPAWLSVRDRVSISPSSRVIEAQEILGWLGNRAPRGSNEGFLQVTRCRDGALAWIPAGAVHPALDHDACFDGHHHGIGCGVDVAAIKAARLSAREYQASVGTCAGGFSMAKPVELDTEADDSVRYLSTSAKRLGITQARIAIVLLTPDAVVARLFEETTPSCPSREFPFGAGETLRDAVIALMGRRVARAQLDRYEITVQTPQRSDVRTQTVYEIDASSRAVHTNADLHASAAFSPHLEFEPWWIDVTSPDVALTADLRIVRVLLVSRPPPSGDATHVAAIPAA